MIKNKKKKVTNIEKSNKEVRSRLLDLADEEKTEKIDE